MKIVTLVAVVGGMLKSVVTLINLVAIYRYLVERDWELVNLFYDLKVKVVSNNSEIDLSSNQPKINTVIGVKNENLREVVKFNFFLYMIRCCRRNTSELSQTKVFERLRSNINDKMDVYYLYKHFENFEVIKEMLLTNEQMSLLENKSKIEVEA